MGRWSRAGVRVQVTAGLWQGSRAQAGAGPGIRVPACASRWVKSKARRGEEVTWLRVRVPLAARSRAGSGGHRRRPPRRRRPAPGEGQKRTEGSKSLARPCASRRPSVTGQRKGAGSHGPGRASQFASLAARLKSHRGEGNRMAKDVRPGGWPARGRGRGRRKPPAGVVAPVSVGGRDHARLAQRARPGDRPSRERRERRCPGLRKWPQTEIDCATGCHSGNRFDGQEK